MHKNCHDSGRDIKRAEWLSQHAKAKNSILTHTLGTQQILSDNINIGFIQTNKVSEKRSVPQSM